MSLWIPGPTEVRPELLAECARPMIGHRSKAMSELVARLDPGLRLAFGLAQDSPSVVAAHTTSATGLMEAALLGVGPRVLCLENGAFSARWRQVAELVGKDVHALGAEWGAAVPPEDIERALREHGPFDALIAVVNETSTGVRTPLADLARARAAAPDTLLLVDVVSYLAGAPVDFDAHGLDFALAGVQKALALPPGVSVLCASQRYLAGARGRPRRGFYLDPVAIVEGHVERKTPCTPAIGLYYALAQQLEDISEGRTLPPAERSLAGADAWRARYAKHERMQAATAAWAARHGLEMLAEPLLASPTVSCVRAGSVDVPALVKGLGERGFTIGAGYGKLKAETFRIGHMGDHTEDGLERLLAAADAVLGA